MKPQNVMSTLMMGTPNLSMSSFLMEGAIHYAELGHSILYISAKEFQSLPPSVHGLPKPTPDVFSLIRFMYLPRWQDLLQHLSSLHLHSQIPSVLIVEAIEQFLLSSSGKAEAPHVAFMFASLLDGAAVCAKRSRSKSYLIVSLGEEIPHPLIDLFFSDVVWVFEKQNEKQNQDGVHDVIIHSLGTLSSGTKQFCIDLISYTSSLVLRRVSFWENFKDSLRET